MNILHLNDLHLKNPGSGKEALRSAFYLEYLSSLFAQIKSLDLPVDCLIITGDFVDQAQVSNYDHAKIIIQHIIDVLAVPKGKIFFANGNHDIPRDTGDRKPFKLFQNLFYDIKSLIVEKGRYSIYEIDNKIGVLCLDSIGDEYVTGRPSPLSNDEMDEIVTAVRDQNFDNILIVSHHPPASYSVQNQAPFDESNTKWSQNHIWHDGGALHKRIASDVTIAQKAFWFAGDIHRPEFCIIDQNRVLIITGNLNIEPNTESHIKPQARIVCINDIENSHLFQFELEGHVGKGLEGNWVSKPSIIHRFDTKSSKDLQKTSKYILEASDVSEDQKSSKDETALNLHLIDPGLQETLYKRVLEKHLYEFGRFDTNSSITSLSWVSIHRLMDSHSIFSKIIKSFKKVILHTLPSGFDFSKCLLVGIDPWGSILASRVGAAINMRSCCVAVRSHAESYDSVERINEDLQRIVKKKEVVFVVSDVISTGRSVLTVRKELSCSECANWYILSIFCDPSQERDNCFQGYKEIFYCCGSVKMPIIHSSKLPNHEILQAKISFVR